LTIDNFGIGFADEFKYNYKEVRLLKGFLYFPSKALNNYPLSIVNYQFAIKIQIKGLSTR